MDGMSQHQRRSAGLRRLKLVFADPSNVRFIHYSCESFYDRSDGPSPRVTSIAVRHYASGQTRSFSIHQVAEREGLLTQLDERYDELEYKMLEEFFEYVRRQPDGTKWFHWNMRDANYGFAALEHRFDVLHGEPVRISDADKVDLPVLLKEIYGPEVAPHPRFENLVNLNDLSRRHFLNGAEEAVAFEQKEYVRLHQSTLKKVDLITELAELAAAGRLKTTATWRQRYGVDIAGLYDALTEHPVWKVASLLAVPASVIGGAAVLWSWT